MVQFWFRPDVDKQLALLYRKSSQSLGNDKKNPAKPLQKRLRKKNDGNIIHLNFFAVNQSLHLWKVEKDTLMQMTFKETTFVKEILYFFVHKTNCCCLSLQTLVQEVNLGKKIHLKTKRHEKVFVEQGTLLVFG